MIQPVDRHRERLMRGSDQGSGSLFSYVDLESRVRGDHPLRPIREIVNGALSALSADFEAIYAAGIGRPSILPERLLRALLLQAFYGIRSERQIMERLEYDLLFRWFVGLGVDDASWDPRADRPGRITLGADKGYDAVDFVNELRSINVAPHVAAKANGSAIDERTTRHAAYKASQVIRKRIEEVFGWTKSAAGLRKTRHRGLGRVGWQFTLTMAAYNLIRLPKLLAAVA